jgi:hypothetical protein
MNTRLRILVLSILVVWGVLLSVVSLSPVYRLRVGLIAGKPSRQIMAKRNHRLAHWIAFGVLSFFLALLGKSSSRRIAAFVGIAAFGALIELLQHVIYINPLETWDIRDDIYGALAGFLGATVMIAVDRRRRAREVGKLT